MIDFFVNSAEAERHQPFHQLKQTAIHTALIFSSLLKIYLKNLLRLFFAPARAWREINFPRLQKTHCSLNLYHLDIVPKNSESII